MIRAFVTSTVLLVACLCLKGTAAVAAEPSRQPDILFIAFDDLNDWVNCLGGHPGVKTPNIDRLAARGVLFANANCAAPICNPSRTSLMTGIRPSTSGVYGNSQKWRLSPVLNKAVTIPEHFMQHGYTAKGGGKIFHALEWFDGDADGWNDPKCWDEYFPTKMRQMPHRVMPANKPITGSVTHDRTIPDFFDWQALPNPDSDMPDYKVVDWATRELKKPHEKPLFLACGIFRPHIPWYVPKKYYDMYPLDEVKVPFVKPNWMEGIPPAAREQGAARRKWHEWVVANHEWEKAVQGYEASIAFADAQLGRLLEALDATGRADKTVIVMWADHGFHLGDKETWEKFTLWEESARVPLVFIAPGITHPGGRCDQPASLLDIYPTLVELAGHSPQAGLEGRSLLPQLRDPAAVRDEPAVCTHERNNHSVRSEHFRYTRYANGDEELYDHRTDQSEWTNLANNSKLASVKAELAKWIPKTNVETRLLPDTGEFPGPDEDKKGKAKGKKAAGEAEARPATVKGAVANTEKPTGLLKIGDYFAAEVSPQIAKKAFTISCAVTPAGKSGVIAAQGGDINGYALYLKDGNLIFAVRIDGTLTAIVASQTPAGPFDIEARLASTGAMGLAINGAKVAEGIAPGLIPSLPHEGISVGSDETSAVGDYNDTNPFTGKIERLVVKVD